MNAQRPSRSQAASNVRYFREAYRTGEHGWGVTEPSPDVLRLLGRARELVPAGRLLDLGCGEGRHSVAAASLGFEVVGVDYEPLALQRARGLIPAGEQSKIFLCAGSALALPFQPASFDVVLDYGCFHHQRKADWPAYRANLLRALKPQGLYILSVFSPTFHLFHGSSRRWHLAYGSYRRYFTHEEIARLWQKDFELLELIEQRGEQGMWHVLFRLR
ncbi:MAG: class I SAM-dependent methyltransferase [Armatimonadota bacterium]|nr:class I SAM-dependent methyltransferase [Armatimonadota bacterium]